MTPAEVAEQIAGQRRGTVTRGESPDEAARRARVWRSLRKKVQKGARL